jgi:hypothetical protein
VPDDAVPTSFNFTNNLVYATNESSFLFEGDYVMQKTPGAVHAFHFDDNLYWSTPSGGAIANHATWGGCDHSGSVSIVVGSPAGRKTHSKNRLDTRPSIPLAGTPIRSVDMR